MFLVKDDYHYLWLGLVLIALGSVLFELAQVPYFAMIRQVSTPDTIGRVSGLGWAFGYLGGIVLLLLCYFGFVVGDGDTRGFFGVSTDDGLNIRLITILAAVWFFVFALPVLFMVPELPATASPTSASAGFLESYRILFADVRELWRSDRSTVVYLMASALYRDGLAGIFTFGAVLAVSVYGIAEDDVLIFGVAANVVAAAGALVAGRLDDSLGPRFVIVFSLVAMLATSLVSPVRRRTDRVLGVRADPDPVRRSGAVGVTNVPGPGHAGRQGRPALRAVRHDRPRGLLPGALPVRPVRVPHRK